MLTLSEEVANREARLRHLELKSQADENLISLLKQQNKEQADRLVTSQHQHDLETQRVTQERDVAVQKAMEVSGIIESLCRLGLEGLNRMQGAAEAEQPGVEPRYSRVSNQVEPARGQLPPPSPSPSQAVETQPARARPSAQAVEETLRKYPVLQDDTEPLPIFLTDHPRSAAGDRRLGGYHPRR